MTQDTHDLPAVIAALETRFDSANDRVRAVVRAEVHALIARNRAAGHPLPESLVDLERRMVESATDDGFDNMPV